MKSPMYLPAFAQFQGYSNVRAKTSCFYKKIGIFEVHQLLIELVADYSDAWAHNYLFHSMWEDSNGGRTMKNTRELNECLEFEASRVGLSRENYLKHRHRLVFDKFIRPEMGKAFLSNQYPAPLAVIGLKKMIEIKFFDAGKLEIRSIDDADLLQLAQIFCGFEEAEGRGISVDDRKKINREVRQAFLAVGENAIESARGGGDERMILKIGSDPRFVMILGFEIALCIAILIRLMNVQERAARDCSWGQSDLASEIVETMQENRELAKRFFENLVPAVWKSRVAAKEFVGDAASIDLDTVDHTSRTLRSVMKKGGSPAVRIYMSLLSKVWHVGSRQSEVSDTANPEARQEFIDEIEFALAEMAFALSGGKLSCNSRGGFFINKAQAGFDSFKRYCESSGAKLGIGKGKVGIRSWMGNSSIGEAKGSRFFLFGQDFHQLVVQNACESAGVSMNSLPDPEDPPRRERISVPVCLLTQAYKQASDKGGQYFLSRGEFWFILRVLARSPHVSIEAVAVYAQIFDQMKPRWMQRQQSRYQREVWEPIAEELWLGRVQ